MKKVLVNLSIIKFIFDVQELTIKKIYFNFLIFISSLIPISLEASYKREDEKISIALPDLGNKSLVPVIQANDYSECLDHVSVSYNRAEHIRGSEYYQEKTEDLESLTLRVENLGLASADPYGSKTESFRLSVVLPNIAIKSSQSLQERIEEVSPSQSRLKEVCLIEEPLSERPFKTELSKDLIQQTLPVAFFLCFDFPVTTDILSNIYRYLDRYEVAKTRLINKGWCHFIDNNYLLWKEYYKKLQLEPLELSDEKRLSLAERVHYYRDRVQHYCIPTLDLIKIDRPGYSVLLHNMNKAGTLIVGEIRREIEKKFFSKSYRAIKLTVKEGLQILPLSDANSCSGATNISENGAVIVGMIKYPKEKKIKKRAVKWTSEGLQLLEQLNEGRKSSALAVSADGSVIVGWATDGLTGKERAVKWTSTGIQVLDQSSSAFGNNARLISADGSVIAGEVWFPEEDGTGCLRPVKWTSQGIQFLSTDLIKFKPYFPRLERINREGTKIIGAGRTVNGVLTSFVWSEEGIEVFPTLNNGHVCLIQAINETASIMAGYGEDGKESGASKVIRWKNGKIEPIGRTRFAGWDEICIGGDGLLIAAGGKEEDGPKGILLWNSENNKESLTSYFHTLKLLPKTKYLNHTFFMSADGSQIIGGVKDENSSATSSCKEIFIAHKPRFDLF